MCDDDDGGSTDVRLSLAEFDPTERELMTLDRREDELLGVCWGNWEGGANDDVEGVAGLSPVRLDRRLPVSELD